MGFVRSQRLWETSTTTGAGPITLAGAVANYRAFSSACANGDTVFYTIVNQATPSEWETGLGTWGTGGILTRTTVLESSNAGALVSFGAGAKDVFSELAARGVNDVYDTVDSGETLVVPAGHERIFSTDLTVNGTMTVNGRVSVR
jgi:hypothetical protein